MLQVLLVDDEPLELQALQDHVNWKALGVGRVMTARNGKIAYESILEQEPDIVVTDVHMPVMDGITLARKIHALNRKIKVVFLSGYNDFSYVKSAMQMGAVDYLLKPFTGKSVEAVIRKVKDVLDRERLFSQSLEALERQLLERLCTGSEAEEATVLEELSSIRRAGACSETFGMLLFFFVPGKSLADSILKNMTISHAVWSDEGKLAVLLHGCVDPGEGGRKILNFLFRLTGQSYSGVYLTKRYLKTQQLPALYRMLKSWETSVYYSPAGSLLAVSCADPKAGAPSPLPVPRTMPQAMMEEHLMRLEQLFPYENEARSVEEIDRILKHFQELHLGRSEAEAALRQMLLLLGHRLSAAPDGAFRTDLGEKKLENCQSADALKEALLAALRQILAETRERESGKNAYVVRKVKEYVQMHYGEPMTIEAIAEEIHLSVNYVRSIFKDGTGQTILEYVTDYRFARACELLQNPALRVKDVANMVGYENISYFGSVFTRRYRMTPNEYRKKFVHIS